MRPTTRSNEPAATGSEFLVPDHVLLKCIGKGSYGQVFLARNVLGEFRAVKVISRSGSENDRAFERELHGLRKFEPISRSHAGFLNILHVGHDPAGGYFYYVMELGDPVGGGPSIDPDQYEARTLEHVLRKATTLPVEEVLQLGLRLSDALECLHQAGLVHRDLKPSNIVFVEGLPKMADIGMVTGEKEAESIVGTLGYIPPEGPGTAQADIFALGRVLYECLTGQDRCRFPDLSSNLDQQPDPKRFLELNEVVLKAGHQRATERYEKASELHADLKAVEEGRSLARLRELERKWKAWRSRAVVLSAVVATLGIAGIFAAREQAHRRVERERETATTLGASFRDTDAGDYVGALKHLAQAVQAGRGDPQEPLNRLRFTSTLGQIPKLAFLKAFGTEVDWCGFMPGDREVLVALGDGHAQVIDLESGLKRVEFLGHTRGLLTGAISEDGKAVATGGLDSTARLWEADTGRQIHQFLHTNFVMAVKFHPSEDTLITACADGWLRWWNRSDGKLTREILAHSKRASSVAISRDGRFIVSGGRDGKVRLWNAAGAPVGEPLAHGNWVTHVALSPDDKRLLVTCADNNAYLWELASRTRIGAPMPHHRGVASGEFNPSGRCVMTCSWDGALCLWNAQTGAREDPVLRQNYTLTCATFSDNGRRVAAGGVDGVLRVWDYAGRNLPERLAATTLSANGRFFGRAEGTAVVVNGFEQRKGSLRQFSSDRAAIPAAISDDGRYVALVAKEESASSFRVWDTVAEAGMGDWTLLEKSTAHCLFAGDNRSMVVWQTNSFALRLVSVPSGQVQTIRVADAVRDAAFSPDNRLLAIAAGNSVQVRDVKNVEATMNVFNHSKRVEKMVFGPRSDLLAVCTADGSLNSAYLQVWNVHSGREKGPKLWHEDGVLAAAWFPDGRKLATASEDGTARIWDLASWHQLGAELNHRDEAVDIDLKGNALLLTASWDKCIRIADAQSGLGVGPPIRFPNALASARWHSDSTTVMARQIDGQYWTLQLPSSGIDPDLMQRLVNLLAGRVRPGSGLAPHEAATVLESEWRALKAASPGTFTASTDEVVAWCRVESQRCRQSGLGRAELGLLDQLLGLRPDDALALVRKQRLEEEPRLRPRAAGILE